MILPFTTLQLTSRGEAFSVNLPESTHTFGNTKRTAATTVTCQSMSTQRIFKSIKSGTHINKLLIVAMVIVRTSFTSVLGSAQNNVRALGHIWLNS
jgi:hypothetical protein